MHSFENTSMLMVTRNYSFFTAIKQRMEKDIDEVGKIARQAKTKVDELEKDVCSCLTLIVISICLGNIYINKLVHAYCGNYINAS
jgi:uncharacterized protein Yka (UPF0111/DUF47 family)